MLHFARPFQEAPQVAPLAPKELPEFQEADLLHLQATIGLNPPEKVWTTPWREPVPASCIPHETDHGEHSKDDIAS